ncbi:hypothetical protein PG988_000276 [Apiospora saccharicola]
MLLMVCRQQRAGDGIVVGTMLSAVLLPRVGRAVTSRCCCFRRRRRRRRSMTAVIIPPPLPVYQQLV